MSRWYFVPDDWEMSDSLREWTKSKGLTDQTIEDELESFRDHQYKRPMMRPDACWRNWVKNGLKWGNLVPVQETRYNQPEELSEDEREADRVKAWNELNRLRGVE